MKLTLTTLTLLVTFPTADSVVSLQKYGMYVWRQSFDADAPYCNGVYPATKDGDNAACFNHAWETPTARTHLFSSCNVPGRDVGRIFLSDVLNRTSNNGADINTGVCDDNLIATLEEAHANNMEVYGLFAASNAEFSEQNQVAHVNEFNLNCATATGFFDGVAVNNEHFSTVKACNSDLVANQTQVLTDLEATKTNAAPLPLHFSVSWNWDCCMCSESEYTKRDLFFNGQTKSALEHMIDIADSVDVQVAWNKGSTMARRAYRPYDYWLQNKAGTTTTTAFYVLAYTNPNSDCRLSFAPHAKGATTVTDACSTGNRTEPGMYAAFDEVMLNQTSARGGIHYMGGVYSSGMPGWPKHLNTPTTPAPITPSPVMTAPVSLAPVTPIPTAAPVPCTLSAVGESCTIDSDCCSGQCSGGKPSSRVCLEQVAPTPVPAPSTVPPTPTPPACGAVGDDCTTKSDCCSDKCNNKGKNPSYTCN